MNSFVIGICGGSGTGKSTLAFGLLDSWPDKVTVFHLDDYFRPENEVPSLHGMVNWDDPGALYSDKMVKDLSTLKSGMPTVINTKSPRLNPDFLKTGERIPVEFQPKPIIVVEGFLTFYFGALRNLFDLSIYLEASFNVHTKRRVHGKLHNFPPNYNNLVLEPMHKRYVFPYKKYADLVIDTEKLTKEDVLKEVMLAIEKFDSNNNENDK